jgi:hypothetical protein
MAGPLDLARLMTGPAAIDPEPMVGNARSAILLLECLEEFIGAKLFNNPEIQLQVCSPGRLDPRRSALLAIGFYLGPPAGASSPLAGPRPSSSGNVNDRH